MGNVLWRIRGTIWLLLFDRLATNVPDDRFSLRQAWSHMRSLAEYYPAEGVGPREAYFEDNRHG